MANEPITREEILLNAVATGEATNLKPITREEMFLAKLGGADVNTPTPITRKEQFLQKAIENSGNTGGGSGGETGGGDTTRTYTVRFYNGDTLLQTVTDVPYGGNATYTGDEPVKEGDWIFNGWNPAPTNVTADMDCYAQFRNTAIMSRKLVDRTLTNYEDDVVESVRNYAFRECSALATADLPAVTSVGIYAFYGCSSLATANIPAATSIDSSAFYNCKALTTVILRNTAKVATLSNANAFGSTPIASGTGYIYVPRSLVDSYKTATNWSTYANQFRAIEDYPDVCGGGN